MCSDIAKNTSYLSAFSAFLFAVAAAFGCGEPIDDFEEPNNCSVDTATCQLERSPFISVDEAEFLRRNDEAILVDARPDEGAYLEGHIPGARFGRWVDFRDEDGNLLEDTAELEQLAGEIGLDREETIIVYGAGDGSGGDSVSGRYYWMLEYFGHDDVYLLDGGVDHWVNANYEFLASGPDEGPTTDFSIDTRRELIAGFDDVKDAIEESDDVLLIDTRRASEWEGDEDRGNPQAGHIPEAVHYHWEWVFDDDNTLRDADELRDELADYGITNDADLTIPYCQSGVRSGYFYAVLQWLGFDNIQNYDGSWYEWSRQAAEEDVNVPEGDQ